MITYENWLNTTGQEKADELREWLDNKPDFLNFNDIDIYDVDDFIETIIQQEYEDSVSDYNDRMYHEWKENGNI